MSVYQRGVNKTWYVDFEVAGRRIKQPIDAKNKREARAIEEAMRTEQRGRVRRGQVNGSMTLDDAIDRYIVSVLKPKSKPEALKVYLYMLHRMVRHFGSTTKLEKIATKAAMSEWRDNLLKEVAPGTVKRYLNQLKAILNCAVEWGCLDSVPDIANPIVNDKRLRWLTEKEEKALLAKAPDWLKNVIIFAIETGARKTNVIELRWNQVDLDRKPRGIVHFRAEDTKQREYYSVPLSNRCTEILKKLKAKAPKDQSLVFLRPNPRTKLTIGPDGKKTKPLEPIGEFKRTWDTARTEAKLSDIHFHDLRHTFASRLVMRGVPLYEVSKLMGHKSIRMTERYAHLQPDRLDSAIAALDRRRR